MKRGAWWATTNRVANSRTGLKRLSTHTCTLLTHARSSAVNFLWLLYPVTTYIAAAAAAAAGAQNNIYSLSQSSEGDKSEKSLMKWKSRAVFFPEAPGKNPFPCHRSFWGPPTCLGSWSLAPPQSTSLPPPPPSSSAKRTKFSWYVAFDNRLCEFLPLSDLYIFLIFCYFVK